MNAPFPPVLPTYNRTPLSFVKGDGAWLYAASGDRYLDLTSGIAVNALGHAHPALVQVLTDQAQALWHVSNLYTIPAQEQLAQALVDNTFADTVFFTNSGTEAAELAIKMVRKYWHDAGEARPTILTFEGAFHGRSTGAIAAAGSEKMTKGFGPLMPGFKVLPWGDHDALNAALNDTVAAVMLEPVQGEGGIRPATIEFMQGVRALCDKHNILYVVDEIQCGVGRTGVLYGHMYGCDAQPDIMTLAKALGCGVPIGATLLGKKVEHTLQVGSHGSTFGGNPLMCAVAIAAMKKINTPEMMQHVCERAEQAFLHLNQINDDLHLFKEIRGRGLMIGAELIDAHAGKAGAIAEVARQHGVLVLVAGPDVSRLLPPLNITEDELREGLERFHAACKHYLENDA